MKIMSVAGFAGLLLLSSFAMAESAPIEIVPAAGATPVVQAPVEGAKPVLQVSAEGENLVKVNTGNAAADALGNLASKCAERSAAFKTCDSMGGFKGMGCRKMAEFRYKEATDCPSF